ncbi:hypothetical protein BGZ91_003609 [Linnemannia elongata]|nr:hypothetical protein BGZ91_003609 [Linnemannia elongata]
MVTGSFKDLISLMSTAAKFISLIESPHARRIHTYPGHILRVLYSLEDNTSIADQVLHKMQGMALSDDGNSDNDITRPQSKTFNWAHNAAVPTEMWILLSNHYLTPPWSSGNSSSPISLTETPMENSFLAGGLLLFANGNRTVAQRTELVSQAINMARTIGVHTGRNESLNSILKAYLACVFWRCFIYDSTPSVVVWGPTMINDEDITVDMFEAGDLGMRTRPAPTSICFTVNAAGMYVVRGP